MRGNSRGLAIGLAVLGGLAIIGSQAPGAEPDAEPPVDAAADRDGGPRVAALIRELGAPDYAVRQGADDRLARFGMQARRELEAALDSEDLEVRLRAGRLLDRVKAAELWTASIVEVGLKGEPASQGFAAIARQSLNPLALADPHSPAAATLLTLPRQPAEFWRAVDDLCRRSDNHVRPNYDPQSPGLVVATGGPGEFPTAYAGPLRVQITSARRAFSEELDYETTKSAVTHTFLLNLRMMWEDRFRLMAHAAQPTLVEALPDAGKALAATPTSGASWNVISPGARQITASLRVTPPAQAAKKLATLRMRWGLAAVGDMDVAEIKPVAAKQRLQRGDLVATIESLERQPSGRCEVSLLVARELELPEPQEILLEENQVSLWDQHGRRFRALSQSNSLTDGGALLKLSFTGDAADSEPTALRVAYPRLRGRREVDIVFHDVPLPTAQPD